MPEQFIDWRNNTDIVINHRTYYLIGLLCFSLSTETNNIHWLVDIFYYHNKSCSSRQNFYLDNSSSMVFTGQWNYAIILWHPKYLPSDSTDGGRITSAIRLFTAFFTFRLRIFVYFLKCSDIENFTIKEQKFK